MMTLLVEFFNIPVPLSSGVESIFVLVQRRSLPNEFSDTQFVFF